METELVCGYLGLFVKIQGKCEMCILAIYTCIYMYMSRYVYIYIYM